MLLKDDPRLEDDVADDKADTLVCLQRSSCHSGCTVLANREGGQEAGYLVPQEAP